MDMVSIQKYAQLAIHAGVNLQQGQTLVISAPVEVAAFVHLAAAEAYAAGAREVVMNWTDEKMVRLRFMHADDAVFDEFPQWRQDFYTQYLRQDAAFLSIAAEDPDLLKKVDPARIMRVQKAGGLALKEFRERLMANRNTWTVISVPTPAWATKVFPTLSVENAVEELWKAILQAVRADLPNPAGAWEEHKSKLKQRLQYLNDMKFKSLHYTNAAGTDLTVELPAGHIWFGGAEYTPDGREFIANIPTEEVYTLPQKYGVQGTVVSAKPLNYNGSIIEDFSLHFEDGKIVSAAARQGQEVLDRLLAADDGSAYLGEVALVPYSSPISRTGILFYNTLFDENASCHLALGKAYPVCLVDGEKMTAAELAAAGVNDSIVHVDFMVGTRDLDIKGTTAAGEVVQVFCNGNFAF